MCVPDSWGSPGTKNARRMLLLGSGELGKEVVIEAQRLGLEVIAVDRYDGAPAMQVAHRSHTIDMRDASEVRRIVEAERPDWIVPEIEAIATDELLRLEEDGFNVVPTARATRLTMDREGIRRLAAEELGITTSPYRFASSKEEYDAAIEEIGLPVVVKPTMSSSGKGQSTVRDASDAEAAWEYAASGSRTQTGRLIVEGFVEFDYEITLLTVRHRGGTSYCAPIGHRQEGGDYQESWQPMPMSEAALQRAQDVAKTITDALGGRGLFGVELFIQGDKVIFSEVSPRPHDTGLVTLVTQPLSEFALHVRAITGLPIPAIEQTSPGASAVLLAEGETDAPTATGMQDALQQPGTHLRLFGKPDCPEGRRMGVALATAADVEAARQNATEAAKRIRIGEATTRLLAT